MEYSLTELGRSFTPVLRQMLLWSEAHLCPPGYVSPCGGEEPYVISLVTNSSTSFSKIRGQSGSTIRYPTPISVKMYSGWAGFFSIFRRIFAILTRKIWLSLFAPGPQS